MLHRRKFLGITTLSVASKVAVAGIPFIEKKPVPPLNDSIQQLPHPENASARILETKIICKEPGHFAGPGSEYKLNINGHVVIQKKWLSLTVILDGLP